MESRNKRRSANAADDGDIRVWKVKKKFDHPTNVQWNLLLWMFLFVVFFFSLMQLVAILWWRSPLRWVGGGRGLAYLLLIITKEMKTLKLNNEYHYGIASTRALSEERASVVGRGLMLNNFKKTLRGISWKEKWRCTTTSATVSIASRR